MQSNRVCAIDSGVRDIITLYDPGGLILGVTDCKDKIFQRCLSIDRLQSKLASEHRKRHRYRLIKLIYRMYQRIKCMVKDMHQKCSKWLSVNYDEVLLPKFATSEMTQKQKRISSKTSRAMLKWSHYKFKVMLADKMGRTGGRMIECTEPYTSKTWSRCGRINYTIKKQKTFQCP
ncbi:Transposase IS605, OrfB, C-terminal [Phytophthora cactorum]|nr:Transposase IS605, OrfB, C-terminal [Phytophthora cactorum]